MVAQVSRRRGRRLQHVGGGVVRVLAAQLGWKFAAEVAELRFQLDLSRLALDRLGAPWRAVQP